MYVSLRRTETAHLASVLSLLLSPALPVVPGDWFTEIAHALRLLVGAPRAAFHLEAPGGTQVYGDALEPRVTCAYVEHYARLDLGLQQLRATGLEVWSRRELWRPEQLRRSEYYNDFARPNGLLDTVGVALALPAAHTYAHVALIHDAPVATAVKLAHQMALLSLVRSAFRVGVTSYLQRTRTELVPPVDPRAPLLDATEDPHALYDGHGRLLHRNPAMVNVLGEGRSRAGLREAVAQAVRALLAGRRGEGPSRPRTTTHAIRTDTASYRVRVSLVAEGIGERDAGAVLVTLRRSEDLTPSADELCARFGLTAREGEVAAQLLERRSNAEIAAALDLSAHTARHHTEAVLQKLGVHSRTELARAIRRKDDRPATVRRPSGGY